MINAKGVENEGFQMDENSSQPKLENEFELKEHSTVSFYQEDPKPEAKNGKSSHEDEYDGNFVVRWNLKIRAELKKFLFGKGHVTKIFWIVLVNGAAAGFLVATVIQYLQNDNSQVEWCHGVGFIWVVYCLVYMNLLYYLVNKYLGDSISGCTKPLWKCVAALGANKYFRCICYLIPVVALGAYVIFNPGRSGRRIFSFLGIVIFIILGYIFSKHPAHVNWRPVICGTALQFIFGLLTIQWETGKNILDCLGKKVTTFLGYTEEGAFFVFGHLAKSEKGPIFAFSVLPVIYFLCFFINILSYYGALQWFILKISTIVRMAMGTTVCESVNAAGSIFLGMTEAPLLIQTYLKDLTKSEICAILCAGWSTVAGVVMAAYIQLGVKASHLIAASVMSAPASLAYSKLVYPETVESKNTVEKIALNREKATNALDAASKGALSAILIIGSITANIIAFLAFIAFLDGTLHWIGAVIGFEQLSFQYVMSKIFYPISFLMGVDVESLEDVAFLIGIKTVANEFQAYQKLGELITSNSLSERSEIIATYALCGFSNFGSIGITIGTLSAIEPSQRSTVTEVAFPAFVAANVVCFLTACVAGCLID